MMPAQHTADATICSDASSSYGQPSLMNNASRQGNKVKAYVDFSDFNRNYDEYLRKTGLKEDQPVVAKSSQDKSKESDDSALERSNSSSSQSTEDWVVLSKVDCKSPPSNDAI